MLDAVNCSSHIGSNWIWAFIISFINLVKRLFFCYFENTNDEVVVAIVTFTICGFMRVSINIK